MDQREEQGPLAWAVENRNRIFIVACLLIHVTFVVMFSLMGLWIAAGVNVLSSLFYAYLTFVKRKFESSDIIASYFEILVFCVVMTVLLSMDAGFYYYITGMIAVIFLLARGKGNSCYVYQAVGFVALVVSKLGSIGVAAFDDLRAVFLPYQTAVYFGNLIVTALFVIVASYLFAQDADKSFSELSELSFTDELTGLPNRRYLLRKLDVLHAAAQGGTSVVRSESFSVAIIDIDDFKKFNDTWGHDVGDIVLQETTRVFAQSVRDSDDVVRWGGEEFVVYMPGCPLDTAAERLEQMRAAVEGMCLLAGRGTSTCLHVTVTIGAAESMGRPFDDVVAEADQRLYMGKRSGKNQVVARDLPTGDDAAAQKIS